MAQKKIKIDKDLYEKCEKYAVAAGYSSADEFIQHVLEKTVNSVEEDSDQKKIEENLKGLGYIG